MSGTGCVGSEHLHPEGRGYKVEKSCKMMERHPYLGGSVYPDDFTLVLKVRGLSATPPPFLLCPAQQIDTPSTGDPTPSPHQHGGGFPEVSGWTYLLVLPWPSRGVALG